MLTSGSQEYFAIEERAAFYRWFQGAIAAKSHEVKWPGAAADVATLAAMTAHSYLGYVIGTNAEIRNAAEHGNKLIFDDVFPKLRALYTSSLILKGAAARRWDEVTLAEEQVLVQPMYSEMSARAIELWQWGAEQGYPFAGAWIRHVEGVDLEPFPVSSNVSRPADRWMYGMTSMGIRNPRETRAHLFQGQILGTSPSVIRTSMDPRTRP